MPTEREKLAKKITDTLKDLRKHQGWSIDDLAGFLDVNSLTVRNAFARNTWSELLATVLKWAKVIPEDLYHDYKKAIEREKIEKRKNSV